MDSYIESEKFIRNNIILGEKEFFEDAYNSRKFLIDENVIHLYLYELTKHSFQNINIPSKYSWKQATELYNYLLESVITNYLLTDLLHNGFNIEDLITGLNIKFNNDIKNKVQNLINNHSNIVTAMQNRFILELIKNSASHPLLMDHYKSTSIPLPNYDEVKDQLYICFLISAKYGIYLHDLINQFDIDSVVSWYYNKNKINEYLGTLNPRHVRIKDLLFPERDCGKQKFHLRPTVRKRTFEYIAGNKNKNSENSVISASKDIFQSNFHTNSVQGRLLGLWLWDLVNNPKLKKNLPLKQAIKYLIKKYPQVKVFWEDNCSIILHRYYNRTKECILDGKILSFSSDGGQP